jgi:hypothetical protein
MTPPQDATPKPPNYPAQLEASMILPKQRASPASEPVQAVRVDDKHIDLAPELRHRDPDALCRARRRLLARLEAQRDWHARQPARGRLRRA